MIVVPFRYDLLAKPFGSLQKLLEANKSFKRRGKPIDTTRILHLVDTSKSPLIITNHFRLLYILSDSFKFCLALKKLDDSI